MEKQSEPSVELEAAERRRLAREARKQRVLAGSAERLSRVTKGKSQTFIHTI